MNAARPTIVFTGGGTLGHLFAGLAVADSLRDIEPRARLLFAGRGGAAEREHVARAGYDYWAVACHPWPRRPWAAGHFLAANLQGFLGGKRLLRAHRADAVVGLGGYASAPVGRAAASLGIPLVLLEQNAVPGRVNRWLRRHATCVCASFAWHDGAGRVHHTGNPVRRAFFEQPVATPREKLLLVTGGSAGASALNAAVPEALARLGPLARDWRIVHQAGERDVAATRDRYHCLGLMAEVTPFADMPTLLPRAGLVVCRAGGSTIAELLVTGTPAILCPYPHASDDHQRRNAAALGDACRVVEPSSPDFADRLAGELAALLTDSEARGELSRAIECLARPAAARQVARIVLCAARGTPIADTAQTAS
ncbi:MAG TPA: UDP-N-acetylglucosamine--N-acetylmuramyl-(pentapeptide) pyrophosphoryl-undecaprenol N-acetylglucosamine transferase [Pirellulales bacterium]|nr:UDP-N-acetylglucosamine--N-acetylmuramyl-(pentapeptide) pyrophosphoryl-undecaprenol N-acetylglucosamine transferase [Pirellulales bacterium]